MVPASADSRASWARDLIDRAVYLDKNGGTSFAEALGLPISFLGAYFDSSSHEQHVKQAEEQRKLDVAVLNRLDALLKAFGMLARAMRGR